MTQVLQQVHLIYMANSFSENSCNKVLLMSPSNSDTPNHMLTENQCWKWDSASSQGKIPCGGNTILDNWASSVNRMLCIMCNYGCSLHRITHSWHDLPVRCCTLWRWHTWKSSWCKILHTSVLHQSSWKFGKLRFPILLPAHHLCAFITYVVHSPEGRSQSTSKFCLRSQMFCDVEFC
jgi:hypothetical protein